MPRPYDFNDLIRAVYRAAAGITDFDAFLRDANRFFDSDFSSFMSASRHSPETKILGIDGMSEREVIVYNEVFAEHNPMLRKALPALMAGEVVRSTNCISDGELRKTPFFSDWLRPADLYYSIGFTALTDSTWIHNFVLARSPNRGDYEVLVDKHLEQLAKHFCTATAVHKHVSEIGSYCHATTDALEHLQTGVILLSPNGVIIQANRSARKILRDGNLLAVTDNKLTTGKNNSRRLDKFVIAIKRNQISHGMQVVLNHPTTRERCCFSVFSISDHQNSFSLFEQRAMYVLFISTANLPTQRALRKLADEFGLTPREIDLVAAMASGSSLAVVAEHLGVSEETARTHRRHVYQKLEIHSAAELNALVHQLAAIS